MWYRNRAIPILGALVVLALAAALISNIADRDSKGSVSAAETDATRTISVNGEGRVTIQPDTFYITIGIDELDADLATAQSRAAEKMNAVIDALKAAGVAEDDIQTSGYSIYMDRDYNQPSQPILGYHVTHTVNAKVRDLSKAGTTIEAAVNAGANNIQNVWFGLENQDGAIKQARELAVADARAKAEELARLTNATLGPVQSVSESSGGGAPVPYATDLAAGESDARAMAPTINPGTTEVVMSVSMVYAIS
jgi:uncharacterized protein YggE